MFFDVIIIGAGAAGMMCALQAGKRGRKVLLLDHNKKVGAKILISGGGRCNFTNTDVSAKNFVSQNPHFCKSALSRFTSDDFVQMVQKHQIAFREKKLGQLFCDRSSSDIVKILVSECETYGVKTMLEIKILAVSASGTNPESRFTIELTDQKIECQSLVVATGGLSLPKIGASHLGYEIAKQFNLKVTARHPALDGFVFSDEHLDTHFLSNLSGVSVDCILECGGQSFRENILFTHKGLSGPAALQGSLYWNHGQAITVNLCPELDVSAFLSKKKKIGELSIIKNVLGEILPARLSESFCLTYFDKKYQNTPLSQVPDKVLSEWGALVNQWKIFPSSTVGYNKAEVTRGGVSTDELSSKNMESKKVPGLYFIGEVVDVTGWLGGYNFQWAWASGWAAAQTV